MKKTLSLALAILLILSAFCTGAYAEEAELTVSTSLDSALVPGELAKVNCDIINIGDPIGASIEFYIDGELLEGVGSQYFVLNSQNNENFDFTVPEGLDPYYQHTLLAVLKCADGKEFYSSNIFTISEFDGIGLNFYSVPLAVTQGWGLYYGIEFSVPDDKAFEVSVSASVRGYSIESETKKIIIRDGHKEVVYVPETYNMTDPADFEFVYTVNADGANPAFGVESISSKEYAAQKRALEMITPVRIAARVTRRTNGYSYASLTGYVTTIDAGTAVEYLNPDNHNSMSAAKIKLPSGLICWVPMNAVYISRENYTIPDTLTDAEREAFVNAKGYSSKTGYLIWVNKQRQRLTVFMGSEGKWKAAKTFPVATGKNATPTPTIVCEYKYKTRWVTSSYICDPVLALFDGYALHNQPVSHSGYVIDRTIGNPASAGCVRMLKSDADWLYFYIPVGTTIVLY